MIIRVFYIFYVKSQIFCCFRSVSHQNGSTFSDCPILYRRGGAGTFQKRHRRDCYLLHLQHPSESPRTIADRLKKLHKFSKPPSQNTVSKWWDTDHDCRDAPRSGAKPRFSALDIKYAIGLVIGKKRLLSDGTHAGRMSVRAACFRFQVDRGLSITRPTLTIMLHKNGFNYRIRPAKSRLTQKNRDDHKLMCDRWGDRDLSATHQLVFTDLTHVNYIARGNRRNDGVWAQAGDDIPPVTTVKHTNHEHVYGILDKHGLGGPIFIEDPTKLVLLLQCIAMIICQQCWICVMYVLMVNIIFFSRMALQRILLILHKNICTKIVMVNIGIRNFGRVNLLICHQLRMFGHCYNSFVRVLDMNLVRNLQCVIELPNFFANSSLRTPYICWNLFNDGLFCALRMTISQLSTNVSIFWMFLCLCVLLRGAMCKCSETYLPPCMYF